jgi:helicase
VRRVRYLLEEEEITGPSAWSVDDQLVAVSRLCRLNQLSCGTFTKVSGGPAAAARDAFDLMWGDHAPGAGAATMSTPASAIVPAELTRFLPFQDLNPAQAAALPEILAHDQNLFVVAPTGAGKTVIGMAAVLRAVVQQGRKAAWLVPQRSLTDELDSELAAWRGHGLRVERLSGENAVDIERIHDADLWVATTEKFEAICRTSAFRDSLADVGALVVDEIHMLGDPARGPILEALLARIRDGVECGADRGLAPGHPAQVYLAAEPSHLAAPGGPGPLRLRGDRGGTHPPHRRDRRARHGRRGQRACVLREQA